MRHEPDEKITFRCNICDHTNRSELERLTREEPSCTKCGSTVRMRSIIQVLTTELFGSSLSISEIAPPRPDIVGIGMSCWDGYALPLAHRIGYTNTYYHQEPLLDITNINSSMENTLDFVISTDVYEHVAPPVSLAFTNTQRLLKPDGVFVFSVPFSHPGGEAHQTEEHFPNLFKYEIIDVEGKFTLKNTTRTGEVEHFDKLIFHGGPGTTLEMRVFSEWSLVDELEKAGFQDVTIYSGSDLPHGIYWKNKWSVPVSARLKQRVAKEKVDPPPLGKRGKMRAALASLLK